MNIKISKQINFINFNQDYSCFCIGNDEGYEIYNTDPFKKIVEKKLGKNGVSYITMLSRTNILGIVLKNTDEELKNEQKLLLWDDKQNIVIGSIEFITKICYVYLRKNYCVVSLQNYVYIYNLQSLTIIKKIKTYQNTKGIVDITFQENKFLIGCLSEHSEKTISIYNILDNIQPIKFDAHKSQIALLQFSNNGNLIATSSKKGTLIRIFHTLTGDLIKELRRGSEPTYMDWIKFSREDDMILCRSKKGTIHLFNLKQNQYLNKQNKKFSMINYFKKYLPKYFSSEWSFAHFHFQNKKTISVFSEDLKHIIVISFSGIFYKINFTNNEYVSIVKEYL